MSGILTLIILNMQGLYLFGFTGSGEIHSSSPALTFRSQILVDMDVQEVRSPDPRDELEWVTPPGWFSGHRAKTTMVLVRISPALIDSAVDYWAAKQIQPTETKRAAAGERLRKLFIREGEMAFLLLVKPIQADEYEDAWRVQLGPIAENVHAVTLDGATAPVIRTENSLEGLLSSNTGIRSCLFYINDIVDEEKDPSFSIVLEDMHYYVRSNFIGPNTPWIKNEFPSSVYFRLETGEINLLHLAACGIPWSEIEARYIQPRIQCADDSGANDALMLLADVAINVIMALLLKI